MAPLPSQRELESVFGQSGHVQRVETDAGAIEFTAALVTPEEQLSVGVNAVSRQGQVRWVLAPMKLLDLKLESIQEVSVEQVPEAGLALVIRFQDEAVRRLLLRVHPEVLLSWGNVESTKASER